jgi:predicted RNA-binding Zn ribbon-like protein
VIFAHDTIAGLTAGVDLVNSEQPGRDDLLDAAGLDGFLDKHAFTGRRARTDGELEAVRALRAEVRAVWGAPGPAEVATLVNRLLVEADARPWLTDHDGWAWHLHFTATNAPIHHRVGAEVAMALADLVRMGELDRLQICAADECRAVLVDFSRNRSRRFCDTGNCGNRQHVAAYRARRRQALAVQSFGDRS